MNKNGLEIERKFLIKYPDTRLLSAVNGVRVLKIEQCYLEQGVRLRKIEENGKTLYIKTVKERISDIVRKENEWEIDEKEYCADAQNIRNGTSVISKVRYVVPYSGKIFEIDVFPFWEDRAFLEIELEAEDEDFILPPYVTVIKEVTSDYRYNNSSLAKSIITEILP